MRPTVTLDDEIAARLQAESRKTGRPFNVVLNEYRRSGLAQRRALKAMARFRVEPVSMGAPRHGRCYDNIGAGASREHGGSRAVNCVGIRTLRRNTLLARVPPRRGSP